MNKEEQLSNEVERHNNLVKQIERLNEERLKCQGRAEILSGLLEEERSNSDSAIESAASDSDTSDNSEKD